MKFRDKKKSKAKDKKPTPPAKHSETQTPSTKGETKTGTQQEEEEEGEGEEGDLVDLSCSAETRTADHVISETAANNGAFEDNKMAATAVWWVGDGAVGADDTFGGVAADDTELPGPGVVDGCLQTLPPTSPLPPPPPPLSSAVEAVHHEDGTVQLGDLLLHR